MGNTQSTSSRDASSGAAPASSDARALDASRLKRFHTGASQDTSAKTSPTPTLRRLSTTATGSAHREHRRVSRSSHGRGMGASAAAAMADSNTLARASSSDRRGTISASGSPRALEREQAWQRHATGSLRGIPSSSSSSSASASNRLRTRSGSIGNLLTGGSRRSIQATMPAIESNQRGSEFTFRRKKSIDLSDVVDKDPAFNDPTSSRVLAPLSTPFRQSSTDSSMLLSPATDASNTSSSTSRLRQASSPIDDTATEDSSSPSQSGITSEIFNPMFPIGHTKDPLGRKQPKALPSYLKIPTLIPSAYASPTSSAPPSPPAIEHSASFDSAPDAYLARAAAPVVSTQAGPRLGLGATTAAAILNTEDVVLAPGEASKVSSPLAEDPDSSQDTETASISMPGQATAGAEENKPSHSEEVPDQRANNSRTPTPTPGSFNSARAMTPTDTRTGAITSLSAAEGHSHADANDANVVGATSEAGRRPSLQLYTGTDSGTATPALPIGLTSGPSSALTPAIPTFGAEAHSSDTSPSTPLTKETNNLKMTMPGEGRTPTSGENAGRQPVVTPTTSARGASTTPTGNRVSSRSVPLVPIVVKWRGGGKEVFVTGTFANEWRSKILLRRNPTSSGKKAEYSCVLHLAPGTHRLKFIVDDRWRVSRDLSTASDGEGNLTNYIEVAHTGPAHPGPLSAPGEDLLAPEEDEERRRKQAMHGHKATTDLLEEARRAEALQRGDLMDVFGDDKKRLEEKWTQEIPPSIIKAQAAEEAHRMELEAQTEMQHDSQGNHRRSRSVPQSDVPVPPTLPRQLEKVILNSSSAAVVGTVDDNSVLPAPNHAVLHHLTASAIKSGVIATGCTVRYRKKYITTVYYRAAS